MLLLSDYLLPGVVHLCVRQAYVTAMLSVSRVCGRNAEMGAWGTESSWRNNSAGVYCRSYA